MNNKYAPLDRTSVCLETAYNKESVDAYIDFEVKRIQAVAIWESGAKIGVHSWYSNNRLSARDLPKSHPSHKLYLDYFTTMVGSQDKTCALYHFIINSAPSDSIYWLTEQDIKEWNFATKFIE